MSGLRRRKPEAPPPAEHWAIVSTWNGYNVRKGLTDPAFTVARLKRAHGILHECQAAMTRVKNKGRVSSAVLAPAESKLFRGAGGDPAADGRPSPDVIPRAGASGFHVTFFL